MRRGTCHYSCFINKFKIAMRLQSTTMDINARKTKLNIKGIRSVVCFHCNRTGMGRAKSCSDGSDGSQDLVSRS